MTNAKLLAQYRKELAEAGFDEALINELVLQAGAYLLNGGGLQLDDSFTA